MSDGRGGILGEIATEAGMERSSFLNDAAGQLTRFLDGNKDRIRDLGGMVLIDEDPDYLSIAPDGSFRSRSRYQDDVTGEWISETEVIESAAELVELYNPADIYSAFAEAARAEAGLTAEPTGAQDLFDTAGVSPTRPSAHPPIRTREPRTTGPRPATPRASPTTRPRPRVASTTSHSRSRNAARRRNPR